MASDIPDEKAIFNVARQIGSPDARTEYLRQACGTDSALRERVEVILRAYEEHASFLELPAPVGMAPTIDAPARESPDTLVGPYKLLHQIGEGGMGTVWMAQQSEPVKRVVALKLIKAGMDSKQVIARFEAERQALALMDHPNIARVLDGGTTETGRPYFVMDLVKGMPITKYCDEHHLTPRQRLELFVPVCQAVQHAHQKGIIHRDLKPSNVLVAQYDGRPSPKVIDFGVAKAAGQSLTDKTLVTGFGNIVGTLEYMSPEQAEVNQLDIDTRSDIYSLGVLLYELLTGSTPFSKKDLENAGMLEMLRVIREQEPSKPSTKLSSSDALPSLSASRGTEPAKLTKIVRGELDWIVMKALEKDRSRRYETANGFAMDVQRYLAGEAVQAVPPSASYRLRKFARRNKAVLLTLSMLAAALLLGSVISTWHALRARQAEALAKTGFEAEKEARGRAVAEAAKATAISALLQDALQSADPYKAKGSDYTVRQLLDDLSRSLGERLKDQPEAEAATRSTIGIAYSGLGRPGDAEPHLQRALDLRRTLLGPDHIEVAQSLLAHSYNAFQLGNPAAAEREAREALDISRKTADTRETTLYAFGLLAFFLEQQQKHAESRAAAEEALAFARNAGFSDHPEVAKILHNQVQLRINLGDLDGAEKLARDALAMHRRVHGTDHPEFGWGLYKLGVALEKRGEYAESEEKLRGALTIFRKHFDEKRILIVSAALQHTLLARGDEAGAAELRADDDSRLAKALELQKGNSNLRMLLGNRLRDSGDLDRAIAQYSEVITRDPTSMDAWVARGECRFRQREYVGAAADFAAAVKLKPEHRSTMAQDQMAHCHRTLGEALVHTAKPQEAQEAFQNSIDIWSALATAHPKGAGYRHALAYAYQLLANLHASQRRFADADAGYEKAADCTEKLIAEFNDAEYRNRLGSILLHWAFSCKADNRLKEAERCFRDAVLAFESLRTNSPKDNRWAIHELGYIQLNLGDLLSGLSGREEDAEKAYRQSADYHEKQLAQDAENADYQQRLTWSYSGLAGFLRKTGKRLEALQLDAKRIVLVNKLTPSATLTAEMNTLAWKLATDPDPKLRDPSQAVSLAKKAVELASAQGKYWTTLGVAHYRASDWKSAIAALEQSLKLRNGGDAVDWFFLAMANWKLNDIRAARNWYDKALGWMDKYQLAGEEQNEELSRFRGEATELLDLKSKKD